jgi:hypothetical protein
MVKITKYVFFMKVANFVTCSSLIMEITLPALALFLVPHRSPEGRLVLR